MKAKKVTKALKIELTKLEKLGEIVTVTLTNDSKGAYFTTQAYEGTSHNDKSVTVRLKKETAKKLAKALGELVK